MARAKHFQFGLKLALCKFSIKICDRNGTEI